MHIYGIPPQTSAAGHTAALWTTQPPIFTARLRVLETATPHAAGEKVETTILLEDPSNAQLFAAAPYAHTSAVQHALDSSRFFAVRVQGEGGMKATLGVGFEERSEAFDFGIALQEAGKVLGFVTEAEKEKERRKGDAQEEKRDYSLKEGETITVNLGKGRRRPPARAIEGDGTLPVLAPPPSAGQVREKMRLEEERQTQTQGGTEEDFGDFQ